MKPCSFSFLLLLVALAGCTNPATQSISSPPVSPPASPSPSPTSTPSPTSAVSPPEVRQNPASPSPNPSPLPVPTDGQGDYVRRTDHQSWVVVDSDPEGLNCRWSDEMPIDWYAPGVDLPPLNISQWKVVRRFAEGTLLTANQTPAGFVTLTDSQNKPWLKVSLGPNDQICLVRANQKYVKPV